MSQDEKQKLVSALILTVLLLIGIAYMAFGMQ